MFTFSPGRDITVGRGADTDIRVDIAAKQAISRVHIVLRADTTQWVAVDKSRNGIYADGKRGAPCRSTTTPASRSALRTDRR
jgi:pSer/pThr/pTyr-binding forkhead associated (FHA) protein